MTLSVYWEEAAGKDGTNAGVVLAAPSWESDGNQRSPKAAGHRKTFASHSLRLYVKFLT